MADEKPEQQLKALNKLFEKTKQTVASAGSLVTKATEQSGQVASSATTAACGRGDHRLALDVFVGQFSVNAVDHRAQIPGVDEQRLTAPFAKPLALLFASQEPQTDGNPRGVEQLTRHGDHAVHQIGFDN